MIRRFNNFEGLKYSIYDWDDNILYMPSVVHLDRFVHGEWVAVDIPASQFNKYIHSEKTRMRNMNYHETFCEQSDDGPRGNRAFIQDTVKAIKYGHFGPSWKDFIKTIVEGRIFLIITARGHEPESMRKCIKWIINNVLTDEQYEKMQKNLSKFHKLFGKNPKDFVEHYLDKCDFVGVMSEYFKKNFDVPQMKVVELVGYGKSMAIKRFLERIRRSCKKLGLPATVGFSDDRTRTIEEVGEFLSGEKSLDAENNYEISYFLFDTSGKEKRKIVV